MTVKLGFQLSTSVVLLMIALRESVHLCRRRDDLGLRLLVPALWSLTLAATVGIPNLLVPVLRRTIGASSTTLTVNGAVVLTGYLFGTFFLSVRPGLTRVARHRRLAADLSLLLVVAVGWTLVFTIGTPGWLLRPTHTYVEYRHNLELLVFSLVGDVGAVGFWALAAFRGFVVLRSVRQQWAKWGLGLVTAGAATFGLGTFGVATLIDLMHPLLPSAPPRFRILGQVYITALVTGQTLLALGLAFPTLADVALAVRSGSRRYRQRFSQRRIMTLWQLLTEQFPFIALPDHPVPHGRPVVPEPPVSPGGLRDASVDRIVGEVIDGLSWLAPYYRAGGLAGLREDGYTEATPQGVADPRVAAAVVDAALRARLRDIRTGMNDAVSQPPYPRLLPAIERWDELVRWLARLSRALSRLQGPRSPDINRHS